MVAWGTPAVKADRFSVALPAPEMPDPPCLACVGGARGVGIVPPRGAEPREGTSAGWHWHQTLPGPSPPRCQEPWPGQSRARRWQRARSSSHAQELWVIRIRLISVS